MASHVLPADSGRDIFLKPLLVTENERWQQVWEEAHGEAGPALSSPGALRPGRWWISGQIVHGHPHTVPENCHLKAIHPSSQPLALQAHTAHLPASHGKPGFKAAPHSAFAVYLAHPHENSARWS